MKASKWIGMTPLIALVATIVWPLLASAQTGQERREEQQRDQGIQQQRDQQQYGQQQGQRPWNQPASRWQKASDINGKDVKSQGGEKIGDVDDLIVDLESGRVIYALVSCDGKLCAVPATALDLQQDAKYFTVAATKDQLKAYSFEKNQLPNFGDRTWAGQVYGHYNQTPYWERSGQPATPGTSNEMHPWYRFTSHWLKATDIIGKNVKNPQDENLGEIEDLAIDPDGARVIYAVLSFGGVLGIGDKLFAVPMSSLDLIGNQKHFTLNLDKDRLKNAQGFDKNNWPNMADQRWSTETHTFYQQRPYWEEPTGRETRDIGQEGVRGEQKTEVWVCTMHPSVRESKTGKCPICQMTLVREDTQSKP